MSFAITSGQNPRVKAALRLRNRSEREKTGLCIIEGYRELKRAIDAEVVVEQLFFCRELFLGENEQALIDQIHAKGASVLSTTKQVFTKIAYRDRPEGLLAIAVQKKHTLADFSPSKTPFYILAESIEKPGNLGTILRSADAVGVDGLILCDRCTDLYNPNVVRASTGTLFTIPIADATTDEAKSWLQEKKIPLLAATPSAKTLYTDVDLTKGVAIAVGSEQLGLSQSFLEGSHISVAIPMRGVADSLNVATATTLLLYEVLRQRG